MQVILYTITIHAWKIVRSQIIILIHFKNELDSSVTIDMAWIDKSA